MICPNAAIVLGNQVAKFLAKPLLWACSQPPSESLVPPSLSNKVKNILLSLGRNDERSPVSRGRIRPVGEGTNLQFIEMVERTETSNNSQLVSQHPEEILRLQLQTQARLQEVFTSLCDGFAQVRRELSTVKRSINRVLNEPAVRVVRRRTSEGGENFQTNYRSGSFQGETAENQVVSAKLTRVNSLHELWKEYEFGIRGRNPAKKFLAHEIRLCKTTYSRRKCFWKTVERMMKKGYSSNASIDRIYAIYGESLPVTKILLAMTKSRRQNTFHPDLR